MSEDKRFLPLLSVLISMLLVCGISLGNVDLSGGLGLISAPLTKNNPVIGHSGTIDDGDIQIVSAASKKRVGSWNSDVYHKPTCRYVKAIKSYNKRYFASPTAAKKSGYRPCKICKG